MNKLFTIAICLFVGIACSPDSPTEPTFDTPALLACEEPRDEPRPDEPRGDEPRGDEPRPEEPRGDEPRGDEPRDEEPRGDEPRDEEPREDEPRGDEPPPPPPPPPVPGGSTLALDFDDPANLGVTCAQGTLGGFNCREFFNTGYRKHTYLPNGGVNGTGAINMHWQQNMSIGFSPLWIQNLPLPASRHFKIRFAVKQTAVMQHAGSGIKIIRLRRSGTVGLFGTMTSNNGRLMWHWDAWTGNDPISPTFMGARTPADGQWHIYELEWDYSDINNLTVKLSIDGVLTGTARRASTRGDVMSSATGPLVISPFAEMYSCGNSGACSATINTGDFTVDDFTYTELP